ncbi:O-acetyl-ADP-ribose deacetylase [Kitasatospora sp. NPDC001175]|uniref:O-acetyl-ADP-ribose deacetylase n=1 Tax=Kitasatospora sp. NPDC001175 TaxID=3157103 RepID=UPI003D07D221
MTQITLVEGDVTEQQVDGIVNAANSSLLGGGGVDGAIHRRGGPEILADCRRLRASRYGRGLPTGQAVATTAGRLPARWVVHTVGPVHLSEEYEQRAELLASCYRESLRVAVGLGVRTVAFPAISAGVYGWPLEDAARIALTAVAEAVAGPVEPAGPAGPVPVGPASVGSVESTGLAEVRFVLFGAEACGVFERVWRALERRS